MLNSANAVSGDTQVANYYVAWNEILDSTKKYWMHWTYIGEANTITGNKIALVYLNMSNVNNVVCLSNSTYQTNQCIGFLKPVVFVGSSNTDYLQAEDNTNLPIYFSSIPVNPFLTVSIRDNDGNLFTDNAATPAKPGSYVLTLRFTQVDESD